MASRRQKTHVFIGTQTGSNVPNEDEGRQGKATDEEFLQMKNTLLQNTKAQAEIQRLFGHHHISEYPYPEIFFFY